MVKYNYNSLFSKYCHLPVFIAVNCLFLFCIQAKADNEPFVFNVNNFMIICDPEYISSSGTDISKEDAAKFLCESYLSGNLDGIVTTLTFIKAENLIICLPTEGVSNKGLMRMLRNFIKSKGKEIPSDAPIRGLIFATLANYFPCSKK